MPDGNIGAENEAERLDESSAGAPGAAVGQLKFDRVG